MARKLSTQSRIARVIEALLEDITVANGYNTDVVSVEQVFGVPGNDRKKLPGIYYWFGDKVKNTGNNANAMIELRAPLAISFGVPCERTTAQDEIEFMSSDIDKALFDTSDDSTQIAVPITAGAGTIKIDLDYLGAVAQKVEEKGRGIATGVMVYAVRWPQVISNPALFRPDDLAVDET